MCVTLKKTTMEVIHAAGHPPLMTTSGRGGGSSGRCDDDVVDAAVAFVRHAASKFITNTTPDGSDDDDDGDYMRDADDIANAVEHALAAAEEAASSSTPPPLHSSYLNNHRHRGDDGHGIARAAAKSRIRDLPPVAGAGGFGKVFILDSGSVAFKRGPVSSLLREAAIMRLCGTMDVPCVMPMIGAAADPRAAFIVIAMPAGACDVFRIIRRTTTNVAVATRTRWTRSLIAAVAGLHSANIVHCDIKPSNMVLALRDEVTTTNPTRRLSSGDDARAFMSDIRTLVAAASPPPSSPSSPSSSNLDDDGTHRRNNNDRRLIRRAAMARAGLVVGCSLLASTLSDFGLSRVVRSAATDTIVADSPDAAYTDSYRAPEVRRECAWGAPADVWALACSIVEIFTGTTAVPRGEITPLSPISHITVETLRTSGVPPEIATLVLQTLKNPYTPRARPSAADFFNSYTATAAGPPRSPPTPQSLLRSNSDDSASSTESSPPPPPPPQHSPPPPPRCIHHHQIRRDNNIHSFHRGGGVGDLKTSSLAKTIASAISARRKQTASRRLRTADDARVVRACMNLANTLMHNANAFLDREEIAVAETLGYSLFSPPPW